MTINPALIRLSVSQWVPLTNLGREKRIIKEIMMVRSILREAILKAKNVKAIRKNE